MKNSSGPHTIWTPSKYIQGTPDLAFGTFAPVFWEPLGPRGDRLVIGVLVQTNDRSFKSSRTIVSQQRLALLVGDDLAQSANGVIQFAMDYVTKQLQENSLDSSMGKGQAAFATMSIGSIEKISALNESSMVDRAVRLCSIFGLPSPIESAKSE